MLATPLVIQCDSLISVGIVMNITKFEECPVVVNSPRLAVVLYTGQRYDDEDLKFVFKPGLIHIIGNTSKITFGFDSSNF